MAAQQKNAVITGGASGIGKAAAQALADQGMLVCLCDRDEPAAQAAAQAIGPRASAWAMNVSSAEAVDRTFAAIERKVGPADILVTSAGVPGHGALADLKDELWHDVLGINLNGVFYCMRAALRQMLPRHSGVIVNVSSICGLMGCASSPAYSAAKAGVIGLSKSVARRHVADGIRVNVVAPGLVDTPFIEPDRRMGKLAGGIAKVPLARMGTPEEIAALIAFLCGEDAAYIVGQVISPNGGQLI